MEQLKEAMLRLEGKIAERLETDHIDALIQGRVEAALRSVIHQEFTALYRRLVSELSGSFNVDDQLREEIRKVSREKTKEAVSEISTYDVRRKVMDLIEEKAPLILDRAMAKLDAVEEVRDKLRTEAAKYLTQDISEVVRRELGLVYDEVKSLRQKVDDLSAMQERVYRLESKMSR